MLEGIETAFPEPAVARNPCRGLGERSRLQTAQPYPAILSRADEAGPRQDLDVLQDGRQRHGEWLRELTDGGLRLGEPRQDGSPRRVGQGREGRVERRGMLIVNHPVNLYARSGNVVKALSEGLLRWPGGERPPGNAESGNLLCLLPGSRPSCQESGLAGRNSWPRKTSLCPTRFP